MKKISLFLMFLMMSYNCYAVQIGGAGSNSGEQLGSGGQYYFQPRSTAPYALTADIPTAGGSVNDGTHSYKVTFIDANGVETDVSNASNQITCGAGNNTVPLTNIAIGSSDVVSRKIYRTLAGDEGDFKLVDTIANNTETTYSDAVSDELLGATAPTANTMSGKIISTIDDANGTIAHWFDTSIGLTVFGTKLCSFKNNGVEKVFIDKDGIGSFNGGVVGSVPSGNKAVTAVPIETATVENPEIASPFITMYNKYWNGAAEEVNKISMYVQSGAINNLVINDNSDTPIWAVDANGIVRMYNDCLFKAEAPDTSMRNVLQFISQNGAGDYLTIANALTGDAVQIGADGNDSYIPIQIWPKKTSEIILKNAVRFENNKLEIRAILSNPEECNAGEPTAGGAVTDGTHRYKITFVTNEGETLDGNQSNQITCGGGNNTVPLDNIPLGPLGTIARKIYRTEAGGVNYLYLDIINDNTTTTYEDTTADGGLGGGTPSNNKTSNVIVSYVPNANNIIAFVHDTANELSAPGAKLISIKNQGIEKASIDKDGLITATGGFSGALTGNVTGDCSGNAGTVTNGVYTTTTDYKLATVAGIDAKTVAATTLYTVPGGSTCVITKVIIRCTAADTVTVAATVSVGSNNPNYDNWFGATLLGLVGANYMQSFNDTLAAGSIIVGAGDLIKLNISVGATATSQTLAVDLFGYLL